MSIVVEGSPAYAGPVEVRMLELIEIVDWLSPTDNLIACQWHVLNVFWRLSWLHLLGPAALALALLDVPVLDQCVVVILVKYFVSEDAAACLELAILHDLIVNVFGIAILNFSLLYTLLALVDVDVAVTLVDLIVHRQDFLCRFHFEATCLAVDLLLPEGDLRAVIQLDLFEFLPCALHCHFLFFD